jgi:Tfp pilus assembly protein FimV
MLALSLRQCLEQVAALGQDYVVTDQGVEWTAAGLLASLARDHPDRLDLPMYLRLPDAQRDGAICQVTKTGYILRYRICSRTSR